MGNVKITEAFLIRLYYKDKPLNIPSVVETDGINSDKHITTFTFQHKKKQQHKTSECARKSYRRELTEVSYIMSRY